MKAGIKSLPVALSLASGDSPLTQGEDPPDALLIGMNGAFLSQIQARICWVFLITPIDRPSRSTLVISSGANCIEIGSPIRSGQGKSPIKRFLSQTVKAGRSARLLRNLTDKAIARQKSNGR